MRTCNLHDGDKFIQGTCGHRMHGSIGNKHARQLYYIPDLVKLQGS